MPARGTDYRAPDGAYALVTGVALVWWLRQRLASAAAPEATPEPAR
jgi:hypothetical protein